MYTCMYMFVVYLTTQLVLQAKYHSIHKNTEHTVIMLAAVNILTRTIMIVLYNCTRSSLLTLKAQCISRQAHENPIVLTGRALACPINEENMAYTTFTLFILCIMRKKKTRATPPNALFYNLCIQSST